MKRVIIIIMAFLLVDCKVWCEQTVIKYRFDDSIGVRNFFHTDDSLLRIDSPNSHNRLRCINANRSSFSHLPIFNYTPNTSETPYFRECKVNCVRLQ
jgi:hypothetical protein